MKIDLKFKFQPIWWEISFLGLKLYFTPDIFIVTAIMLDDWWDTQGQD